MKSLDDFEATLVRLRAAIAEVEATDDAFDISKKESESVRILQLLEFQIGAIGQELYETVKKRHAAILRGETTRQEKTDEDDKPSNVRRTKRQSNSKAKRASK